MIRPNCLHQLDSAEFPNGPDESTYHAVAATLCSGGHNPMQQWPQTHAVVAATLCAQVRNPELYADAGHLHVALQVRKSGS